MFRADLVYLVHSLTVHVKALDMRVQFYSAKALPEGILKDFPGIFLARKNGCSTCQLGKFLA
jgi:hypothetical protein